MDPPAYDALVTKPGKKKPLSVTHRPDTLPSPSSSRKGQKPSKKGAEYENSTDFTPEKKMIDSVVHDGPTPGNDYRALRRKYLLLEEESFGLGREIKAVEDDIKTLEDEKLLLLDELVVLEGLVDPLEVQARKPNQ